jgi:H+-transporting ATPase
VTVLCALVYWLLNQWTWLDNLGKVNRSKKNEKMENFIHELMKLTISHERLDDGSDYYAFGGQHKDEEKKTN